MPTFTGICNWGELATVIKDRLMAAGWSLVVDTSGQPVSLSLQGSIVLWAVDSRYLYTGPSVGAYTSGLLYIFDKAASFSQVWQQSIGGTGSTITLSRVYTAGNTVTFQVAGYGNPVYSTTKPQPSVPDFDTATGYRYFDEYLYFPTGGVMTIYPTTILSNQDINLSFTTLPSGLSIRNLTNGIYYQSAPHVSQNGNQLVRPYNSTSIASHWPVQYLLKVEPDHVIIVLQGIYQFDPSARTAIGYVGRLNGDVTSNVVASSSGPVEGILSINTQRNNLPGYYTGRPATLLTSPNFDQDFMLSEIGAYRIDEGIRGTFKNLYACNIQSGALLSGETITASDGGKYTFFNVPTSQDGYYNSFHQNAGAWLAIRH